ncbi:DNA-binding protein [Campylobacter gastrosuis]|uniref:Helix-turn-helix domain-containing protein n=1 Tax=Campylobacter gastrosuis TaxID=2974576 RepID=A0ABT7HSC0_9BACT|nr:DNA-binding protein [Campylobacter gastrosuis]MDL0089523.1 helix-turn-helix domain-containing protein [Campylobacter gastrosuis]
MKRLPVSEVALILGISKEAVYNRIRRGSLKSVEKDGVKFVLLDDDENDKADEKPKKSTQKPQINQDKFIEFLLNELSELKTKNENLQGDKERLFKEKEQMLIDSKNEISQIYKERDEKLMAFLNAMQKPILQGKSEIKEGVIEAEIDDISERKFISLSEFLRTLNLSQSELKKAQKKIIKRTNRSKFIKFKDGVILVKKDKSLKQILGDL